MKTKILILIFLFAFLLSGCEDVLDRPSLTTAEDDTYWTSETRVRLYANEFYGYFFPGYGYKNATGYTVLMGYAFNDDMVNFGNQTEFERSVPTSKGSTSLSDSSPVWQTTYTGPTWNFAWIRKANIMINRIEERMGDILTDEEKAHWLGIGRFFRGWEYSRLVNVFGDVPYYDHEVNNTNFDDMYKPRTPRNEVMDAVYEDFVFAFNNVKLSDGAQYVNRYVVASFIARQALVEGTWQKYHFGDNARATKFLQLAIDAANLVISSGKYDIVTDFRTLFGSTDLTNNKDCVFYRKYDSGLGITHAVASNCNLAESRNMGPSLSLIKAFICNDGKDWQTSGVTNAKNFKLEEMVKSRDPRFEASFWDKPSTFAKGSFLYIVKFIDRKGPEYAASGQTPALEYTSDKNVNGYPVMRYAEVLLNWIEAKAELATIGGPAVSSSDIEVSINKIRARPLDDIAKAKGVTNTTGMDLSDLPNDPSRDPDVPQLIWEIRRERRMELAYEHSRIVDLRRWKKLSYMDTNLNPDLLKGTWVDFPNELPGQLEDAANVGVLAVTDMAGNTIVFDGTNKSKMVGFYSPTQNKPRQPFLDQPNINPYLSPVGINQRVNYRSKGYDLAQTEGWPDILPE